MKAVFYWSQKMYENDVRLAENQKTGHQWIAAFRQMPLNLTIDGKRYNERFTIEDDEPIEPFNNWGDNVLIAVVENVKVNEDGFARDEELEKRIKYK